MATHQHFFVDLASLYPSTAVEKIPLILRLDKELASASRNVNTHCDFSALYIVRSGRGIHIIDGIPHGVARGDVYILPVGATHSYSQHENLSLDAFYFRPEVLTDLPLEISTVSGRWLHLGPGNYHSIRDEIEEIRIEWTLGSAESSLLARLLFMRLWVHRSRLAALPTLRLTKKREDADWLVSQAVRFIDENFTHDIRITDVASQVSLSVDRLAEVFALSMGRTPRDYLRHVRIERAKHLLRTTSSSAASIGTRVGYPEPTHFSRVFRSQVGESPLSFRRKTLA